MAFVVKAAIETEGARVFCLEGQKTMYGGRKIRVGDEIFVFASENEGGRGLIARGIVTAVDHPAVPKAQKGKKVRRTPRVSIEVRRTASARRTLGRRELKPYRDLDDGRPRSEVAWKLYRQATNKIAGISDEAVAFLRRCF